MGLLYRAAVALRPSPRDSGGVVAYYYSSTNLRREKVYSLSGGHNCTTAFGHRMYQTGCGTTATQTRDGNMVMDASGAMSRL
ncbi:hypothetical protein, partial [Escherichia coli]|uniref:hypothetical protein n=1 Tax=Escherichia coli TaxID=562 RepID=UPI0014857E36